MNIFPQIPGFGAFNQPLPDALGIIAGDALNWVKNTVIQLGAHKDAPPQELETTPEVLSEVVEVVADEPKGDSNRDLAINLSSPHIALLEQSVQAQALPDTSGDEVLAKALAQEEISATEAFVKQDKLLEDELLQAKKIQAKKMQDKPLEEKQSVSASFTTRASKSSKSSRGHHHHHHHKTHKK